MTKAQNELIKLLAESRLRLSHALKIRDEAQSKIRDKIDAINGRVNQLRQQIEGVGGDRSLEDEYLCCLHDLKTLHQAYLLHGDRSGNRQLQKAVEYGEFLLSIYGGCPLFKGAIADVENHIHYLGQFDSPRAIEMIRRLEAIAKPANFAVPTTDQL